MGAALEAQTEGAKCRCDAVWYGDTRPRPGSGCGGALVLKSRWPGLPTAARPAAWKPGVFTSPKLPLADVLSIS